MNGGKILIGGAIAAALIPPVNGADARGADTRSARVEYSGLNLNDGFLKGTNYPVLDPPLWPASFVVRQRGWLG